MPLYTTLKYVPEKPVAKSEKEMIAALEDFKHQMDQLFASEKCPALEQLVGLAKRGRIRISKIRTDNALFESDLEVDTTEFVNLCALYEAHSERKCHNCNFLGQKPGPNETYYFCKKYETGEGLNEKKPVSARVDNVGAENCKPFQNIHLQKNPKPLAELIEKIV